VIDDDYIDRSKLEMLLKHLFPEKENQCGVKWQRNQWIISSAPRFLEEVRMHYQPATTLLMVALYLQEEILRLRYS